MPDPMHHKLTEAVPEGQRPDGNPLTEGAPHPTGATAAQQQRESQKGQEALNAQGGVKDRLVDIGKTNHMGGWSGGRVSDQS